MERDYASEETWPPAYPLLEQVEMANEILLEETRAVLGDYAPRHIEKIRSATTDQLLLEFLDNEPGKSPPLIVGHGLILDPHTADNLPLSLPYEVSGAILTNIPVTLRVQLARSMAWSYLGDLIEEEQRRELGDLDYELLENRSMEECEEGGTNLSDDPTEDPDLVRIASGREELRRMFLCIINARIDYRP